MKIEFWESEMGSGFDVTPETPGEVAQLIRVVQNTKAEKPELTLYASADPKLSIWMKKIAKAVQNNSITNNKR